MLTALQRGIDALIGLLSPERGVRRMLAREVMGRARRLDRIRRETYAAAKSNRLVGPWSPGNTNVNDIIGASSSTVRTRLRQLVRDFPYFARAVNIIVDYVVGAGIVYQARVQDGSGKLDRKTNQRIEDVVTTTARYLRSLGVNDMRVALNEGLKRECQVIPFDKSKTASGGWS